MTTRFIIPDTKTDPQVNEVITYSISSSERISQEAATEKVQDSIFKIGVESTKLQGYVDRDVDGGGAFSTSTNMFGVPYVGQIILCPGGQSTYNNNDKSKIIEIPEVSISTCIITINNNKNIVKTPLVGRDGTVKTYMAAGDFDIQINAILVASDDPLFLGNYNGVYPYNIVTDLISICEAPCYIRIASDYLQMFGVDYLVIESYEISQKEGSYSQQEVSLKCISDSPNIYNMFI